MIRTLFTWLTAAAASAALQASPVDSLFLDIPLSAMPELDRSARMDLLDLWESGLEAKVPGTFGDTLHLTAHTDSTLTLQLADAAVWRIDVTPDGRGVWTREIRLPGRKEAVVRREEW